MIIFVFKAAHKSGFRVWNCLAKVVVVSCRIGRHFVSVELSKVKTNSESAALDSS